MRLTYLYKSAAPHKLVQPRRIIRHSDISGLRGLRHLQYASRSIFDNGSKDGVSSVVDTPADDETSPPSREDWARHAQPAERSRLRRSFSGIQPTGIPHLGNYLGALRQWKELHEQARYPRFAEQYYYEQFFSVVDLHALTSDIPASDRARLRKESYAALLAVGLRNDHHTTLFFQSDVEEHTYLMWILSTIASTGYLSRMTQWKSKLNLPAEANLDSDEATQKLKLGLFSYPVLQAADILLYQPLIVPVGEDQLQHIEFTRTLARGFNSYVKENVFRIPWPVISPAKRIMSLKRPQQKMSKSDLDPKSRILITDTEEDIYAKLRGAVTDSEAGISFDPERRPGVSNLVEIFKHVTNSRESSVYIAQDNANVSMRAFKEMVATAIIQALRGVRERYLDIMTANNEEALQREIEAGATKARQRARATMKDVKQALGLVPITHARRREAEPKKLEPALDIEGNPFDVPSHEVDEDSSLDGNVTEDESVRGVTLESLRRNAR